MAHVHSALRWALAAAMSVASIAAAGQRAYPSKPIRLVVPFPAGGATDIIAREVSQRVASTSGWILTVDNRPGAGGGIGVDIVAKAPPDGYTLVLGQTGPLAINPALYPKLPYDPVGDLAPVGLIATAPMLIVTAATSPYKSLIQLVAAARAQPESVSYASSGNGSVGHLIGEQFQQTAGIKLQHVPYKGAAPALNDVIGGAVQIYITSVPSVLQHIRSGKLRPLAVTSAARLDDLPRTETVAEAGFKGFDAVAWFGILAPAGTPGEVIATLNTAYNTALKEPALRKRLADEGAAAAGGTPAQFASLIHDDAIRWRDTVRKSGAKID